MDATFVSRSIPAVFVWFVRVFSNTIWALVHISPDTGQGLGKSLFHSGMFWIWTINKNDVKLLTRSVLWKIQSTLFHTFFFSLKSAADNSSLLIKKPYTKSLHYLLFIWNPLHKTCRKRNTLTKLWFKTKQRPPPPPKMNFMSWERY